MQVRKIGEPLFVLALILLIIPYGWEVLKIVEKFYQYPNIFRYFVGGGLFYILVYLLLPRRVWMYIFEHELTHLLFIKLSGGNAHSLYVNSEKGGRVSSTRQNIFIMLAPYFFPLYAIVFLGIYFIADIKYQRYILFAVGFSFVFHIINTLHTLKQSQSDIHEVGRFLSFAVIIFMNIFILGLILTSIIPGYDLKDFITNGLFHCRGIRTFIINFIM